MSFLSFYYNPRHPRQFEHKPIYWDPHKEEMDNRVNRIKREMGRTDVTDESAQEYESEIRGSFLGGTTHLRRSVEKGDESRVRVKKNVRLAIILAFLFVVLWFCFLR